MPPKRQKPTREQRVEWVWKPIEDLDWSRKKRADMTPAEREFVEAAVIDGEGNYAPDLRRMKSLLAEHPCIIKTAGAAALSSAFPKKDSDDVITFLIDNGARFEYPEGVFSPVHEAVWKSSHKQEGIEKFNLIFESGLADAAQIGIEPVHAMTSSHRSLLHITATFGYPPLTELLLEHGAGKVMEARLNATADTALHRATQAGHVWERRREVARLLLEHGAYYDIFSASALDDDERLMEILAEDPSAVDARHSDRTTPLHWAAAAGAPACAETLLANGADPNALNSGKKTPLHKAAAPLDAVPIEWTFPPIDKVIEVLAKSGANVNAQDDKGRTPLHLATYGGYKDAAEQLMSLDADTTIRNKRGKNALEVARMACLYLKPKSAKGKKRTRRST